MPRLRRQQTTIVPASCHGIAISGRDATSPRILIVRLSAIGDVIHGMPHRLCPAGTVSASRLTWVVEERAAELLRGHEALDELIVLPRGWLKSPRAVWRLRRRLRAARFDVALEAQGLIKAAIAAWLSGAKRRIGFGGRWGRELSPWLNTELVDASDLHAVQRNLGPAGAAGDRVAGGPLPGAPSAAATPDRRGRCSNTRPGRPLCPGQRGGRLAVEALAGRALGRGGRPSGPGLALPSLVVWGNAEERRGRKRSSRARAVMPGWPPR